MTDSRYREAATDEWVPRPPSLMGGDTHAPARPRREAMTRGLAPSEDARDGDDRRNCGDTARRDAMGEPRQGPPDEPDDAQ